MMLILLGWLLTSSDHTTSSMVTAVTVAVANCSIAYGCSGTYVSKTDESVQCSGYFGCYNAASIHILSVNYSTTPVSIECQGSYSCYKAETIYHNITSADVNCNCYGLRSCSSIVNSISIPNGDINCHGEKSCSNSKLISNSDRIYCGGTKSCENGNLINAQEIYGNGYLSLLNSTIYSNNTISIFLYGKSSGKNMNLICGVGITCTVNCYGNACNNDENISYTCSNGISTNCTINFDCFSAENSILCPDTMIIVTTPTVDTVNEYLDSLNFSTSLELELSSPDLLNIELSNYDNSVNICNDSSSYNCKDYKQCQNGNSMELTKYNDSGTICCTAAYGCEQVIVHTVFHTHNTPKKQITNKS